MLNLNNTFETYNVFRVKGFVLERSLDAIAKRIKKRVGGSERKRKEEKKKKKRLSSSVKLNKA